MLLTKIWMITYLLGLPIFSPAPVYLPLYIEKMYAQEDTYIQESPLKRTDLSKGEEIWVAPLDDEGGYLSSLGYIAKGTLDRLPPKPQTKVTITKTLGVYYHGDRKETYYSSNVLYHYRTGEWWADEEGFYRTNEGHYVVAASDMPQGTVFTCSKGTCIVLDCGCAEKVTDYYVNW